MHGHGGAGGGAALLKIQGRLRLNGLTDAGGGIGGGGGGRIAIRVSGSDASSFLGNF